MAITGKFEKEPPVRRVFLDRVAEGRVNRNVGSVVVRGRRRPTRHFQSGKPTWEELDAELDDYVSKRGKRKP